MQRLAPEHLVPAALQREGRGDRQVGGGRSRGGEDSGRAERPGGREARPRAQQPPAALTLRYTLCPER
ncbi:hypothetical protein ACFZAM_18940 [Streptomyces sp. NPDC008079]|uniref:hypothetical protein n=1 Tax=Streptomyces sp. NPDC008079 TaxID=3364806 RepID=UPI0036DFE4A9